MEPTIINGSDVTVEGSHIGFPQIRITQPDDDIVVLHNRDVDEFIAAIREHTHTPEEPEPAPEMWYVVLKNSNQRLNNAPGVPLVFVTYSDAGIYARDYGGFERRYVPISVDEYERAFGR